MTLREAADRYGPTVAIIVALALLVLLLPANAKKSDTVSSNVASNVLGSGAAAAGTDNSSATTLPGGDLGSSASTLPGGAKAPGATPALVNGQNYAFGKGAHCRADGRQVGISRYMPPCAQWLDKNNFGATSQGVTKDKVLVVRFISQVDPATQAILKGAALADDPAVVTAAYQALFTYANDHYETYGRQVVFQDYNATGTDDNDEQIRNDAVKIATDIKPFLVFAGALKVFGQTLAQRNIVCVCTVTLSSQFYNENPPYIFGALPTSTEYAIQLAEYVGKRLANKPAKFAGDEINPTQNYRTKTRKFGLIYIEGIKGQVDPEGGRAADALTSELGKYGVTLTDKIGYTYDPGRNQQDLTTMIAKLHNDGVTSILMFVDPLYPILITGEATRQQYYPEWIISGSGLSDTTAAGRLYDQQQWKHAFGISPLWVTWTSVNKSTGYREVHHGNPNMKPGDEGVLVNIYQAAPQLIFTGIQMAGPKLTPQSFANGLFSYPRTGGTPASPLVFYTRQYPTAIKDFMEVYYDSQRKGVDERGLSGTGEIMKMNGGKRYLPGQWPPGDPNAFNDPTAVDTSDNPVGGGDPNHEQDGHTHPSTEKCLSCS